MSKRIKALGAIWLLITSLLSLTLVACGATAPGGGSCDHEGLCIDIELQEPIQMNEPVGVTVVVESEKDLSGLEVVLWFSAPDIVVDGDSEWVIDIKAGESRQFSTAIHFPREGRFLVHAGVLHPVGRMVQDYVPVRITVLGGTAYPKETPSFIEPVEPVTPTVLPQALLPSALASPSPTSEQIPEFYTQAMLPNATLGNWVLMGSEDFEGQFPPPGGKWAFQDLSDDGSERFWDDDYYKSYEGSKAAWPANGGFDRIYPQPGDDHYPNNLYARMIYGPFDLSDAVVALTQFYLWREIEANFDYLVFEISRDGVDSGFEELERWSGDHQTWEHVQIEYNDYVGDDSVWVAWSFYSDYMGTGQGPWVDDIAVWKFVPGEVTVQGSLYYYDRDDQYTPAHSMKVRLYDDDDPPGLDGNDDLLAITVVRADGTFQFSPRLNWDDDDTGNQVLDLYVTWETDDPVSGQRVTNFEDLAYKFYSSTRTDVADETIDFNSYIPNEADQEPAVWILHDMLRGWRHIHDISGENPGAASARWEKDDNSLFPCNSSCFVPGFSVNGIFIAEQSRDSADIVVHELGHNYMYNASGAWWWSDIDDMLACLDHGIKEQENHLCAWTEGWASFFALAVNGDECFDWNNTSCGSGSTDLETPTWGTSGWDDGDQVEGRVAGALYDLFDSVDDTLDRANFGFAPSWTIVGDSVLETSFDQFWAEWMARPYDDHLAIQAIFQNTILYNFSPVMVLPDHTALEGLVHNNAIDLGAHTTDPESDDWELEWDITTISDWHCDQVSINAMDYVDVNIPHPGWLGSCDVTVRVDDGLGGIEDTFSIQVVPVVGQVYLPTATKQVQTLLLK